MNPAFKAKYEQMRESKPTGEASNGSAISGNGNQYPEPGHIRNICFVWPNGKKQFLNYSYLVTAEYSPQSGIFLEFTTHTVKMSGLNLASLYDLIMSQIAMRIICKDARYNSLEEADQPVINEIQISKND